MSASQDFPEDVGSILLRMAMRWAEQAWLRDFRACDKSRASRQIKVDLANHVFGPGTQPGDTCPQCRQDAVAHPGVPATPVERYHPARCPYLRALLLDLAERLSRDPALLAEWHQRAVKQYRT